MISDYIKVDGWRIIEDSFHPERTLASESLFALGNGVMGARANFEERYSGESLQGTYIGGIYYPDKTRVGWWKNGYPEYFAKVLNSAFWAGIDVTIDGESLDLATAKVNSFYREMDMRRSVLTRRASVTMPNGVELEIESVRFISIVRRELGVQSYRVKVLNRAAVVEFMPYIDGDVRNSDANYDEKFWQLVSLSECTLHSRTLKSGFEVAWAQKCCMSGVDFECLCSDERVVNRAVVECEAGQELTLYKYVGVCSSLNHKPEELVQSSKSVALCAASVGFDALLEEQTQAWAKMWHSSDIEIDGDPSAQQGIRFCIFMLLQTYSGVDTRLNIGPKGFTGEKYGGVTYWDTEAYCLPFYMSTLGDKVARELLVYRYNQLDKAIENATKLGFKGGAALYPMVTINGEECHNEWEITFEEIHRNGAIAFAIYNYVRYTNDSSYLAEYGLEVLVAIARFWAQRVSWSEPRQKYVMLGVTGPNEYENNVNNNWYTSYIACWCLRYAAQTAQEIKQNLPERYAELCEKLSLDYEAETQQWLDIDSKMYLGEDPELGIFLQQDGYLDKVQMMADQLPKEDRPLNQKWSWDRILRSCFIKQADVLQGVYLFADQFDDATVRRNFDFYEPRTVHESSLSPCVHSILASRLGDKHKAYELYLRTARLDLDDYNHEVDEGCHVTSMAGTWLSVVEGFAGMRVQDGMLSFKPVLPERWGALRFKINYRGRILGVSIDHQGTKVEIVEGEPLEVKIGDEMKMIK